MKNQIVLLKTAFAGCLVAAIAISSCKKDSSSNNNPNGEQTVAADMSGTSTTADNAYNDVFTVSLEAGSDNNIAYMASHLKRGDVQAYSEHGGTATLGFTGMISCATYTLTPNDHTTFPKTVVLDFGTGCTSSEGITRKGIITLVYSNKFLYPGSTVTATFTNYSVEGYKLEGTYAITNNTTMNGLAFHTQVTDGKVTFPDGKYYSFAGKKDLSQISGVSTPSDFSDDVYSAVGDNQCTSSSGNHLYDTITTPLTKNALCNYVGAGVVSFTYNSIKGTLNYGGGDCDSLATITVGPISRIVSLPR